ncbi:ABC transporter, permease protein, partial [human gut metagenome]
MLFKLSIKNMKKSFKDYAIYFLTLVLGVAIFYMFNSLDSQEAMLQVSSSTRDIIKLMISMLGYVSVFVAVVLGLLIVYANNFLINRRKKEFGPASSAASSEAAASSAVSEAASSSAESALPDGVYTAD